MLPEAAEEMVVVEEGVEYSFALEYDGPPIKGELPRAIPINVDSIPIASVVPQSDDKLPLPLPVVQPLSATEVTKRFSKELLRLNSEITVSPTSVIAFERINGSGDESISKELGLASETTVNEREVSNIVSALSSELSSSGGLNCRVSEYENNEFSGDIDNELAGLTGSNGLGTSSMSGELLGRIESSRTVSFNKSRDLSGTSCKSRISSNLDLNDSNHHDWGSNESVLSMDYPSSRVSSLQIGDANNESNSDIKRTPLVTFCGIESDDEDVYEEFIHEEPEIIREKKEPAVKVKKGVCYRCLKGNRFTEKEVCIVCDAKYCSNCVLRAMGSMPEGRKCVTCIGYSIDESNRVNLGKCSRMLKRLLNSLEVRQVMKAEKFCEMNQLPSEYIRVNGKPLCNEELVILESSTNPPKKLKPGNYWYDKVSGLWGKEGQKPSQIITPHLNVGGPIMAEASNGNTQVYINGREITKVELRMLQLAGVQCAGNPHFWVNEDGSYQEEGQKNTKGYIWGKAGTKLVCAVLSLPVPSKSSYSGEQVSNMSNRAIPDYFEQKPLQKLLLIGNNGSGTSTIFKQAKILYKDVPFSENEREQIKSLIQTNVYGYLGILLEGRERFEEECTEGQNGKTIYSLSPRLKDFSDWLLKIMVSGNLEAIFPAATREYAPLVDELWKDTAIKATYKRRKELEMLPSIATYFLERAVDILKTDYEPSDLDILYAEGVTSTNGLACVNFSFPEPQNNDNYDSGDLRDIMQKFELIRVQARGFGENCKWLEMFDDVRIVIFCVSLTDYDQLIEDGNGGFVNKMLVTKRLFESIVCHPTFEEVECLVLLNKFDIFEEKIERVSLNECEWFNDFNPIVSRHRSSHHSNTNNINHNPSLGQLGFHYIAVKFKKLFMELTDRKLYVSLVKGLEPKSVDESLKYAREILKWDDERSNFSLGEYSIYSTEANSFSS